MGGASPLHEAPLVLIGRTGRRRVVTALDAGAEGLGLRIGMPVAKAQALAPGLVVLDAELSLEIGVHTDDRGNPAKRSSWLRRIFVMRPARRHAPS